MWLESERRVGSSGVASVHPPLVHLSGSDEMTCECDACTEDVETPPIDYVSVMDQAAEACWGDMADDFI